MLLGYPAFLVTSLFLTNGLPDCYHTCELPLLPLDVHGMHAPETKRDAGLGAR